MPTLTKRPGVESESTYNALADMLVNQFGAEQSKMFGMPCLKIRSKAFCGLFQYEMVFKLAGDEHKQALKLDSAKLFDPTDKERPMKEWVQVPFAHKDRWQELAIEALKYVA